MPPQTEAEEPAYFICPQRNVPAAFRHFLGPHCEMQIAAATLRQAWKRLSLKVLPSRITPTAGAPRATPAR